MMSCNGLTRSNKATFFKYVFLIIGINGLSEWKETTNAHHFKDSIPFEIVFFSVVVFCVLLMVHWQIRKRVTQLPCIKQCFVGTLDGEICAQSLNTAPSAHTH